MKLVVGADLFNVWEGVL